MKTLKEGQEKIAEICTVLRRETIEPAHHEAKKIIGDAELRAQEIIKEAEAEAAKRLEHARKTIEQERNVFQTSLSQASAQSLERLRQDIEHKLFSDQLKRVIDQEAANPKVISQLLAAIVHTIQKEGLSANFSAIIPQTVSAHEVNQLLVKEITDSLKDKSVVVGDFGGGVKVKLHDKKMTIDLSDEAIRELLSQYLRKDFRKILFNATL